MYTFTINIFRNDTFDEHKIKIECFNLNGFSVNKYKCIQVIHRNYK